MRHITLIPMALLALALLVSAQEQESETRRPARPQDVHVFSQGLVTVPSSSPLYEVQIMVRAGSGDDPAGKEGTANLVAHGLIEAGFGTTKNPVTTQKLAAITRPWGDAAFPSVLVDKQTTTFSMSVPAQNFDEFVDKVLKPMFNQPLWLPKEIDRLRRDSLTAIQSGLRFEDAEGLGLAALDDEMYQGSRFGHPALGTVQGLKTINNQDLDNYYHAFYSRQNLLVATTINDPAALGKLMQAMPVGKTVMRPLNQVRFSLAPGRHLLIITQPNAIATGLHLGFPINLTRKDDDYWPLFVANTFLGSHRDNFGRLFNDLRSDRGYNYGDYSYIEYYYGRPHFLFPPPTTPREQQYFSMWIRPVANQYTHFLIKAITAELDSFVRDGMTAEQVAEAKVKAKTLYLNYAASTTRQLGYRLDDMFYDTRQEGYLQQMLTRIDAVTPEQVNAAIKKYLQAQNLDYVIVTNESGADKLADDIANNTNVVSKTPAEYHMSEPIPREKQKILDQDKAWAAYPLNILRDQITIVKAESMFEGATTGSGAAPGLQ